MDWLASWVYETKTIQIQHVEVYQHQTYTVQTHDGGTRKQWGATGRAQPVTRMTTGAFNKPVTIIWYAPIYDFVDVKNPDVITYKPYVYWCCKVTGDREKIDAVLSTDTEFAQKEAVKRWPIGTHVKIYKYPFIQVSVDAVGGSHYNYSPPGKNLYIVGAIIAGICILLNR